MIVASDIGGGASLSVAQGFQGLSVIYRSGTLKSEARSPKPPISYEPETLNPRNPINPETKAALGRALKIAAMESSLVQGTGGCVCFEL